MWVQRPHQAIAWEGHPKSLPLTHKSREDPVLPAELCLVAEPSVHTPPSWMWPHHSQPQIPALHRWHMCHMQMHFRRFMGDGHTPCPAGPAPLTSLESHCPEHPDPASSLVAISSMPYDSTDGLPLSLLCVGLLFVTWFCHITDNF